MLVRKENEIIADSTFQAILQGVVEIIEHSRQSIAVYVNQEITMMHWHVGTFVLQQINYEDKAEYGKKIVATLSQLNNKQPPTYDKKRLIGNIHK